MAASGTLTLPGSPARPPWRRLGPRLTPALLLLPTAAALLGISVYPILKGLWLSLRDTSLVSPEDRYIGLANYGTLLSDAQFRNAWWHTVEFTAASTLLETLLGLGMALVLHEWFRGRGLVRAAMLVPWA